MQKLFGVGREYRLYYRINIITSMGGGGDHNFLARMFFIYIVLGVRVNTDCL